MVNEGFAAREFDSLRTLTGKIGKGIEELRQAKLFGVLWSLAVRAPQVASPRYAKTDACHLSGGGPGLALSGRIELVANSHYL